MSGQFDRSSRGRMGDIFGKYELIKKIARGGMAEVFLARETGDDERTVAIKRLFPHLTEDEETIDMFLDEGRIAAALHHPNIVEIYDLGVADDFLYIAMEYVHGRDLRSILEEGYNQDNFIPIELAASLGAQVAAGLHYAHSSTDDSGQPRNIVHRDISPQNILVSVEGSVKICDFGIAKAEHRLTHTKAGQVKGKFSYMAPEQIETSHVDARSDVFALGIVLYETTTMTRLFKADTQYEALEKILYAGIEPPTALRAGYPPELERIVMKALERDPDARFQTAEEMHQELDSWLTQNQASTSAVPLARYVRGLFPELSTPIEQVIEQQQVETTGPMAVDPAVMDAAENKGVPTDLDQTVVQEFDREAAMEAAEEASREIEAEKAKAAAELAKKQNAEAEAASKKKDVTEMDEDDLDKALDFALGAPSEADVVISRPTSEAEEVPVSEQKPAVEYDGEDATMISTRVEELAGGDASDEGEPDVADTVADRPSLPSTGSKIVPTVTKEPEVPTLGPTTDPDAPAPPSAAELEEKSAPAVDRRPPGAPPPATRSGSIPTAPPAAKRPPAAESATTRAKAAFEANEPEVADISLDDLGDPADLSTRKTGIIVGVIMLLGIIGVIAAYMASLDTSGSEMEKEVERNTIDPDMLIVEVADKRERVMATIETTPADAAVVVNGMIVERSGGQIPLVKGEPNEVNVYAPGHKPARAYVDGDGSGSPISFTLEPLEDLPDEEKAELDIISEPRDAEVWVDGQKVGTSPTTVSDLWTGSDHHVYIKAEGRFGYVGFIGLVKKSKNEVHAKLEKLDSGKKNYVEVINAAIPRGTAVRWNGEPIGATPGFKNFDRNLYATVELEEPDSVPMRRHIVLEDVGTFELRPFLERMKREKGTITVFVEPMGPEIYVGNNAYGQGPAGNIVLPEGNVKVVLDTVDGRKEAAVEVIANTHTRYTVTYDDSGVKVTKKE